MNISSYDSPEWLLIPRCLPHRRQIFTLRSTEQTDISLIGNEEEKSFKEFKRKYCKISHIIEYLAIEDFKRGRKKPQLSKQNKPKAVTTKAPTIRMAHSVLASQLREPRAHSRPLPALHF